MQYYVWVDTFLDNDVFALPKDELDNQYLSLKNQLLAEHVEFYTFEAKSRTDAIEQYHEKFTHTPSVNSKPTFH